MKDITREGYSKSFEFDSPEYFEQHEDFEEIDDGIYKAEMRGESALVIYNEADEGEGTVDIVGEFNAVRGVQWNHRQQLGADAGYNNGVGQHYELEEPVENEDAREALEEFGVETRGLEQEERMPVASD